MRVIQAKFKTPVQMPDGRTISYVNVENREGAHPDRCDQYDLRWDEALRVIWATRKGVSDGEEIGIPLENVSSLRRATAAKPEEPKIGQGKAGPGRGHKGPQERDAAMT